MLDMVMESNCAPVLLSLSVGTMNGLITSATAYFGGVSFEMSMCAGITAAVASVGYTGIDQIMYARNHPKSN